MLAALLMGFSCGVPLLLTGSVLQAWMRESGVDLTTIGLYALVGLPYTLKFLWSPVLDRYVPAWLGRRRGWMLPIQIMLMLAIAGLGMTHPVDSPMLLASVALLVTFFSASQDIVVDAYRREDLSDHELGLGAALYVNGYRIGMLLAGSGGLILADHIPFGSVYLLMAGAMLVGIVTTLAVREPVAEHGVPRSLHEAVIDPFVEYFNRDGALLILAFILLYKVGDIMASAMTTPFYLDVGFSKTDIGAVAKLFGFWATIAGGLLGGVLMLRWDFRRALWVFGILQAVSTACFALLIGTGPSVTMLAAVIAFENLSGGMGTAAYAGYMASLTDKRFTATQYALLSSLMGVPRVLLSAPTGWLAEQFGWHSFFIGCALVALPGLLLLFYVVPARGGAQRV
jgi:PAT family beta-lactamase induction signal transducer AmpG